MSSPLLPTKTAALLWVLMALFCLRVLGQILVEFFHVTFLPPSEEWFSGTMAYPSLLASQIVIIALQLKINTDFTRHAGWTYRPSRAAGELLLSFGAIYLSSMIVRYIVRMSLYPHERWVGGCIPIFFHWVLSAYVLSVGYHHWQGARAHGAGPQGSNDQHSVSSALLPPSRIWAMRSFRLLAWSLIGVGFIAWVGYILAPTLLAHHLGMRGPEFAVRIDRSVGMPTSDGLTLRADIYRPRRAGEKTPTILIRLPYTKTLVNQQFATIIASMWAERGYTVVMQGTRGRYESDGAYDPLIHERQDGLDTLAWLADQTWFDGRLGMWGNSYFGYTQWVLADCADPGPTAFILGESTSDMHRMFYPGGAFSLKTALYWAVMSSGHADVAPTPQAMQRGLAGFPLIEADDRAKENIPFFNDWVRHPKRDEYWKAIDGRDRAAKLRAPALLLAGWYDPFLQAQLADYSRIRKEAAPEVSRETRLIIGPWIHAGVTPIPERAELRNFRFESLAPSLAWFDQHLLKRREHGMSPVRIFTLGTHVWRDEEEWPLARTQYSPYYLRSDGTANTSAGSGRLTTTTPLRTEKADSFAYDPLDPVPTAGGAMLGADAGMARQDAIETRADVLVYTSDPLAEDLEVTGPISLILHVATTAPNTDFTGKLVNVFPDGSAWNVSEGIVRRSYSQPPQQPAMEITIEMGPTSMVFRKGHRLRLEVSSSNYPRFDRNPNTEGPIATETKAATAKQTVFHDNASPSRLILPIIPRSGR